jgi:predicted dehydrogenase
MTGRKPLGIAMIGTGMVARTHLLAIRDADGAGAPCGVLSRHPDRARRIRGEAAETGRTRSGLSRSVRDLRRCDGVDIASS